MNEIDQFYAQMLFFIRQGPRYAIPGKQGCPEVTLDTLVEQAVELEPDLWGDATRARETIFALRGMDLATWQELDRENPEGFKRLKSVYNYEEAIRIDRARKEQAEGH